MKYGLINAVVEKFSTQSCVEKLATLGSEAARAAFTKVPEVGSFHLKKLKKFRSAGWDDISLYASMGPSFATYRIVFFDKWYSEHYDFPLSAKSWRVLSKAWGFVSLFGRIAPFSHKYLPFKRHCEEAIAILVSSNTIETIACSLIYNSLLELPKSESLALQHKFKNKRAEG